MSNIEEIESEENFGYRLTFKYRIRGIPVILGKNIAEDFIQIDVFNKYIRNYKRFIRKDMNIEPFNMLEDNRILSAFDIINMNYQLLQKEYIQNNELTGKNIDSEGLKEKILSSIEDISLAYLDPCTNKEKDQLIGVWLLKVESTIYAFDIYDGNLIFSKNNN